MGNEFDLLAQFSERARESGVQVRKVAAGHEAILMAADEVASLLLEIE